MQIQNGGNGTAHGLPATPSNTSKTPPVSVRGDAGDHLVDGVEIVGVRADQLASLVARLKEIPTTRGDVVQRVSELLEQGHYSTRNTAERTASSIQST